MIPPGGPSLGRLCLLSFFVPSFLFRSSSWALGSLFDSKGALLSAFASSAARDFLVLVPPQGVP